MTGFEYNLIYSLAFAEVVWLAKTKGLAFFSLDALPLFTLSFQTLRKLLVCFNMLLEDEERYHRELLEETLASTFCDYGRRTL